MRVITLMALIAALMVIVPSAIAASLVFVSPIDLSHFYPERARLLGIEGTAKIRCRLAESGQLMECIVLSEAPADLGFGDAAIRMMTHSPVDLRASGLTDLVGTLVNIPVDFAIAGEAPPPPPPPATASVDSDTPPPPEGEYEDHADGQQFADGVELTSEDRAARQVHSTTPAETGCPEKTGCLAAN